jgi:hypothetical protein
MSEWDDLRRAGLAKAKRAIAKLDPQHAEALLADARRALGVKPKLPELRELMALALEVATPTAIDIAIECSLIVTLRTKPSARARRALYVRVTERLSSMRPRTRGACCRFSSCVRRRKRRPTRSR